MLRSLILSLAFSTNVFANSDEMNEKRAYIDSDVGIVSVYSMPGQNWKTCPQTEGCNAVGWLDSNAQVKIIGDKIIEKSPNPYTGEVEDTEYYYINFDYDREVSGKTYHKTGKGYIDADYIDTKKLESLYKPKTQNIDKCDLRSNSPKKDQNFSNELKSYNLQAVADELQKYIGLCVNKKVNQNVDNPYDILAMPIINSQSVSSIKIGNAKKISRQNLIDIDALARTMYGEMARCYKSGLQYPMAVARVAVNRSESQSRRSEFVSGIHNGQKNILAKVVTSPDKFSVWKPTISGKENPALKQALCPPSQPDRAFWTGSKPPDSELKIWKNTVKIATEAVLYPEQFKKRTAGLKGLFFYTSGLKSFFGMRLVRPSIGDRAISKSQCMQLWRE